MNVVKHARATRAQIFVESRDDSLNITVSDDGKGVDVAAVKTLSSGFGLHNIRQRLRALGGKLEMTSSVGSGCHARITLAAIPSAPISKE
jgi:two-component system NarL family sensor kinase